MAADGLTIATLRSAKVANVWSTPVEGKTRPKQLTFSVASDNVVNNFVLAGDGAVVFTAAADHHQHVWTVGADGQNLRQLTLGTSDESIQHALPNGDLVLSQSGEDRTAHITVTDRDGSNPRPLAPGTGEWPQDVSPDGKTLLYMRVDAIHALWSVPIAGGEPHKIAPTSTPTWTSHPTVE